MELKTHVKAEEIQTYIYDIEIYIYRNGDRSGRNRFHQNQVNSS